jgi:hypothetical protein
MANLIKDRPGLVNDQEEKRIVEILKAAIAPCCWRAPNAIRSAKALGLTVPPSRQEDRIAVLFAAAH